VAPSQRGAEPYEKPCDQERRAWPEQTGWVLKRARVGHGKPLQPSERRLAAATRSGDLVTQTTVLDATARQRNDSSALTTSFPHE
jgi:hypothetical protein